MEFSHSLRLRQQPKLVMTPQLQQVVKLLQLPITDLVDLVQQEIQSNPMLEEGVEPVAPENIRDRGAEDAADEGMDAWLALAAEEGGREARDRDREAELARTQENRPAASPSLEDYLLSQLPLAEGSVEEMSAAEFLIGNLDDNGYLTASLEDLASSFPPAGTKVETLQRALGIVQSLDPPGVGARNLKECLLIQLGDSADAPGLALARRIVSDHLEELERVREEGAGELAASLGTSEADVGEAVKLIRACEPKPGRQFSETPPVVVPEARIEKMGKEYVVVMNDSGLPPLKLSKAYREMMASRDKLGEEERRYLKERFRSALMLMRGIEQRRVTLAKTLDRIVAAQTGFLENGSSMLKPLTLKEVADAIGVHESTVSRVVANKYVDTPRGIYALKDFFSNRLPSSSADGTSGAAVRQRLRELVESEPEQDPLSDDALSERLKGEGVSIARRTVTKYREALKLPPAWQRKANKLKPRRTTGGGGKG